MTVIVTRLFPLWAFALSAIALLSPDLFIQQKSWIVPLLMVVMFCMGMTLRLADFGRVVKRPAVIAIGVLTQYSLMPLFAFALSIVLQLPEALLIGMILVGATSGGTASNVICYLANGDVALSVSLTLTSTLLAVVMTPLLTWLYVGQTIPVDVQSMMLSIAQLILAPLSLGILLNTLFKIGVERIAPFLPLASVIAIVWIIAIIVALNRDNIQQLGLTLTIAVIVHNLCGLLSGYGMARIMGYDEKTARTLAIEVGMQNSGLSVALALKYFSPLAALPGAIFSIWHNLSGSLLASLWQQKDSRS
jgi:BASS family bile acid:Na+ symporter